MTTTAMTLRSSQKRTRSDRVEQDGNVAEQHEQDVDRSGNDMEVDAAGGLDALRDERDEEDEREAAHGLVALRKHDNIVFKKVENVDAFFEGYDDETQGKVIVVAEESKRLAFLRRSPREARSAI